MAKVVTSVRIDDKILKEAKHLAIDEGTSFSNFLEYALIDRIEKNKSKKN